LAAGTTCKNGDQSAYFWPVIRIDREDNNGEKQADKAKKDAQQNQGKSNKDKQNRKNDTGAGADNANQNNGDNPADQNDENNADQNQQDNNANQDQKNQQGKNNDNANQNNGGQAQELPGVNDKNEVAGNDGEIVEPANAELTFRGSPTGDVVAMPKFLKVLY